MRRILAPVASKTAPDEVVKSGSPVAYQELDGPEPLMEGEGEVAGLLHCPVTGGMCGHPAEVHPAGAVLDEHQDVQSLEQHAVYVQKAD